MKKMFYVSMVFAALFAASCYTTPNVQRTSAAAQVDLSGYWNATDVRIVCEALVDDILNSPRVLQTINAMRGRTPVVLVGLFRNESSEHIDTGIIATTMETAIFNSGKMDFVAGGATREALRAERQDQQGQASEATAAALANETGANFMLFGTIRTIIDKAGNQTVRTYYVSAELTNLETNARLWMGQNSEIRKVVVRPRVRI